jgi:hypothetical protein
MNKIVKVDGNLCDAEEFEADIYDPEFWRSFDRKMLELFGLEYIKVTVNNYKVIDESKFTVFLLKYSNYIEEISYE